MSTSLTLQFTSSWHPWWQIGNKNLRLWRTHLGPYIEMLQKVTAIKRLCDSTSLFKLHLLKKTLFVCYIGDLILFGISGWRNIVCLDLPILEHLLRPINVRPINVRPINVRLWSAYTIHYTDLWIPWSCYTLKHLLRPIPVNPLICLHHLHTPINPLICLHYKASPETYKAPGLPIRYYTTQAYKSCFFYYIDKEIYPSLSLSVH